MADEIYVVGNGPPWRQMAARSRDLVRAALAGRRLPDVAETIQATRQEREDDGAIAGAR